MLIHPLIKPEYIQTLEFYKASERNPFDFPLNLDDSGINAETEMALICSFLNNYSTSPATLVNYTKEMERFCQWLWRIKRVDMLKLSKDSAGEFIGFVKTPPYHWISRHGTYQKFLVDGQACAKWRPFSVRNGKDFKPSAQSIRSSHSVLRTFYNYLLDINIATSNPFHRLDVS